MSHQNCLLSLDRQFVSDIEDIVGYVDSVDIGDVIRQRRRELGMSQGDLAEAVGVRTRQVARYEAGEQQPVLSVAVAIADALGISIAKLAGRISSGLDLNGEWWAAWQTSKDNIEYVACQEVRIVQEEDTVYRVESTTRGLSLEDGGYMWRGKLELHDNQLLMGWYVATEAAVRSKGTMFFVVHPHGLRLDGRWVGSSFDGLIVTGWAAMAHSEEGARKQIEDLKILGGVRR